MDRLKQLRIRVVCCQGAALFSRVSCCYVDWDCFWSVGRRGSESLHLSQHSTSHLRLFPDCHLHPNHGRRYCPPQVCLCYCCYERNLSIWGRKFWAVRWKSVAILLGPAMLYMWAVSALIVHYILQRPWIEALIIAACMAPTDPILANSIVSGRFADMHIPVAIRQLLSAESAINDGILFCFIVHILAKRVI